MAVESPKFVLPENPFEGIVKEMLPSGEKAIKNVAVISIDGVVGAGVTTLAQEFEKAVRLKTNIPTVLISYEKELDKLYEKPIIGVQNDFDMVREADRIVALKLLDPANSGKLLITEGRRVPYMARLLEAAAEKEQRAFPAEILTVYLFADKKTSIERKKKQGIEIDEQEAKDLTDFWKAYPTRTGEHPFNINSEIDGESVYDLSYDSSEPDNDPMSLASKIFNSADFQDKVLPLFRVHAA